MKETKKMAVAAAMACFICCVSGKPLDIFDAVEAADGWIVPALNKGLIGRAGPVPSVGAGTFSFTIAPTAARSPVNRVAVKDLGVTLQDGYTYTVSVDVNRASPNLPFIADPFDASVSEQIAFGLFDPTGIDFSRDWNSERAKVRQAINRILRSSGSIVWHSRNIPDNAEWQTWSYSFTVTPDNPFAGRDVWFGLFGGFNTVHGSERSVAFDNIHISVAPANLPAGSKSAPLLVKREEKRSELSFTNNPCVKLCGGASFQNGSLLLSRAPDASKAVAKLCIPAGRFSADEPLFISFELKLSDPQNNGNGYSQPHPVIWISQNGTSPVWGHVLLTERKKDQWVTVVEKYTPAFSGENIDIELRVGKNVSGNMQCRRVTFGPQPDVSLLRPDYLFPFDLPVKNSAVLTIDSSQKTAFNNDLLGVSTPLNDWSAAGFASPEVQTLMNHIPVPAVRFPGGSPANWYDFDTDMYSCPDWNQYSPALKSELSWVREPRRFYYDELLKLAKANGISLIEVFNVMYDSPEKCVRRLQTRKEQGWIPKWIELGNENYSSHQIGGAIWNVDDYISVTKKISSALKACDPKTKTAVNLSIPNNLNMVSDDWNKALAGETYFDGIVLHPYPQAVRMFLFDEYGLRNAFGAYGYIRTLLGNCEQTWPDKKILVTEFNLNTYGNEDVSFDSMVLTLATAEMLMSFFDKAQEDGVLANVCVYRLIEVGNKRNGLYKMVSRKVYPRGASPAWENRMYKRQVGILYELLWKNLLNSSVLNSTMNTALITDPYDHEFRAIPALNAMAFEMEGGQTKVLCVNKLPTVQTLYIEKDGVEVQSSLLESYSDELFTYHLYDWDEKPDLTRCQNGREIGLPPFSVNFITLNEQ